MGDQVPASIGQRLLWQMERHRGGSGSLSSAVLYRLRGKLDVAALERALADLTSRHEALRTTVTGAGRHLTQLVHGDGAVPFEVVELSAGPDAEDRIRRAIVDDLRVGVDVSIWPVRATVYRLGEHDHVLCMIIHHFLTDGWSNALLAGELFQLYERHAAGVEVALPGTGWQYRQFTEWQHQLTTTESWRRDVEFWRRRLLGLRSPELPLPHVRAPLAERRTAVELFQVGGDVAGPLEDLAGRERTTLFAVTLSIFYLLLLRHTGQHDLTVASLFGNRTRRETRPTVGFLANMLLLRTDTGAAGSFLDILRRSRVTVVEALMHQAVPCQMVPAQRRAVPGRRPEDVTFQMLPLPATGHRAAALEATSVPGPSGFAGRFDLEFVLAPAESGLDGQILYALDRFDPGWVRAVASEYVALAGLVAANPERPLSRLA